MKKSLLLLVLSAFLSAHAYTLRNDSEQTMIYSLRKDSDLTIPTTQQLAPHTQQVIHADQETMILTIQANASTPILLRLYNQPSCQIIYHDNDTIRYSPTCLPSDANI